jgi:hypothetical protein
VAHWRPSGPLTLVRVGVTTLAFASFLVLAPAARTGAMANYSRWIPTNTSGTVVGQASCFGFEWCVAVASEDLGQVPELATLSGGSWTIQPAPVPSGGDVWGLSAVSCYVESDCVAVGSSAESPYVPLIETLSDGTWTAEALPATGQLTSVSCFFYNSCVAVGPALIETLSPNVEMPNLPGTWTASTPPVSGLNPASASQVDLSTVSCSFLSCVAVGTYDDASGSHFGAIETMSEGSWSATTAPLAGVNPPAGGDPSVQLEDVSCPAGLNEVSACAAVGTYKSNSGATEGLIETASGDGWSGQAVSLAGLNPAPGSNPSLVFGGSVSCPAAGSCVSVGSYQDSSGLRHGLIDVKSDTTWSSSTAPLLGLFPPASSGAASLSSVSCGAGGSCVAVGSYSAAPTPTNVGLIETLSAGTWTATTAPLSASGGPSIPASTSDLDFVSCASGIPGCVAMGTWENGIITSPQGLIENQFGATPQYWEVASDGGIFSFGNAPFNGSMGGKPLNAPIVGMAATPDGGYWEVASDGGVFSFGDAAYYGSMGGQPLNAPIVGMAATPDGKGYWLVAADGGIFAFGDASFYGSMGGKHLNSPIVGIAASNVYAGGWGYWEVASDGGIFTFGNVPFNGSMGGQRLNAPIVGMAATPDGGGYWEVGSDGGIFSFGDAPFYGSMGGQHLNRPVVSIAATFDGGGYWEVASDGGIFSFGDAPFWGSMGGRRLNAPIVGLASIA